jgi:CheY-like chemotaxis protein
MNVRILHVDDEPDIREVANISLSLNPEFEVRSCASGREAVTAAAEWRPGLILLDVMMPGMDGPMTLDALRKNQQTEDIPVIFVTARAQSREVERFVSLGAEGVISKPFDPMKLALQVSGILQGIRMARLRNTFKGRAESDALQLSRIAPSLRHGTGAHDIVRIKEIAHGLAGAAGVYGFDKISRSASLLEDAADACLDHSTSTEPVARTLKTLLADLENMRDKRSMQSEQPWTTH